MIENIFWLGHASFRIESSPRIYIDPWHIPSECPPADIILVSHEHYDHCSISDIQKIATPETLIIASVGAAQALENELTICPIKVLRPWQSLNVGRANIKAVPAYTFDHYHPASRDDLGFMIALNHYDIYYAGDTDLVHELRRMGCDIAILPVSGKEGLMTIEHARELVEVMRPSYTVPSHYGVTEGGTRLDAQTLETAIQNLSKLVWLDAAV